MRRAYAGVAVAVVMAATVTYGLADRSTIPIANAQPAGQPVGATPYATADQNRRAAELVAAMTPADRAGQVIVASYAGTGSPAALIRELHLGGALPVARNISSPVQLRRAVASVNAAVDARGYPAFTGIDQEGGRVTRVGSAPSFMAVGAANRPALTRELSRQMGLEMRGLGFSAVMAPVADVTIGKRDPIIGTRSAGSDPRRVSQHVISALRGLNDAGTLAVVKHFPGHGSVTTDSHVGLPVQSRSLAQLQRRDLRPFEAAIQQGAPAIMTAHIAVRAVDPGIPASLSRKVTTGLLRGKLGFRGLVITDGLGMGAITRHHSSASAAVKALNAGADVVLMPADARAARNGIVTAVATGRLSQARVDEAATRMIATLLHSSAAGVRGTNLGSSGAAQEAVVRASLTQVAGRCSGRVVGRSIQIRATAPHDSPASPERRASAWETMVVSFASSALNREAVTLSSRSIAPTYSAGRELRSSWRRTATARGRCGPSYDDCWESNRPPGLSRPGSQAPSGWAAEVLVLRRGIFGLALVAVMWLMLRPASTVSSSNDKIDHLLIFGVLTLLGLWARLRWPTLLLGLGGFAVLTEVLQATLTTSRRGDPWDAVADVAGVGLVLGMGWLLRQFPVFSRGFGTS